MPKPPSSLGWRVIPLMGLSVVLLNLNRNAVHVFTRTEDVFNADSYVIASARNQSLSSSSSSSSSSSWNASGSFPSSDPLLLGDNNATAAAVVQLTPSLSKSAGNDSSIAAAAATGAAVVGVPTQVMTPPSLSSSLPVPPADWQVNGTCAIAYVIGGIKPPDRNGTGTGYHGYLYTIMMNTHVMRATGSTADVVVWLQLSHDSDDHELPAADAHLLRLYNIDIRYMPKDRHEDFITIQLEKFRILTMTEYQRVLYLDGDVIVRASLDYLFWYSLQGVFEENVVLSGIMEPSNGGTFMLTPHAGDYERIQNIILATATRNAQLPYPHFDRDVGWGQAIVPPDHFDLADTFNVTRWDFYAAETDQGLLFYWTKYIQQSVTYLIRNFARNWRVDGNGTLRQYREMDLRDLLASHHGVVPPTQCWPGQTRIVKASCVPPHAHFQHMTGTSKPWMSGPPPSLPANRSLAANGREFWFANLVELNNMHNLGINFTNWQHTDWPRHGLFAGQPKIVARVQRIAAAAASAAAANNATMAASASDALSPQPPVAPPNPTNATAVAQVNKTTTRSPLLADALLPKPPR